MMCPGRAPRHPRAPRASARRCATLYSSCRCSVSEASEAGVEPERELPRLRVRAEVEALRQVVQRVLADLGVEARVVGAGEPVLRAHVELEPGEPRGARAPQPAL